MVHRQLAGQHPLMVADLAHPAEVVHHGDQAGDPLDTAPPGQAPDGRLIYGIIGHPGCYP